MKRKANMKTTFLASLFSIADAASLVAAGDAPPHANLPPAAEGTPSMFRPVLNVRDFGAKGDGKTDDTDALVKALEAAGKPDPANPGRNFPATVFIPAGTYRITKTIAMDARVQAARIEGEGALASRTGFRTMLIWDGPEGGHLFNVRGYMALRLGELALDGGKKAGTLLRINSIQGIGTGLWYFERLHLANADTGVELGADLDNCASDMTFVDCNFRDLKSAAFRTMANQNVDYVFIRCIASWVPIGFHFVKGGNAHFILPAFGRVRTAIKIDATGGGINGGVFSITGLQLETFNYDSEKKRWLMGWID